MRKMIGTLAATLAIALTAPVGAFGDHRESPRILKDPMAENTDVYAVLVNAEPDGGSPQPTSNPILSTEMT